MSIPPVAIQDRMGIGNPALTWLLSYQELERQRLALEIHDIVSQGLATLSFRTQACDCYLTSGEIVKAQQQFAEVPLLVQNLLNEVTTLLFNLKPSTLEKGLLAAITDYVMEFRRQTGLTVDMCVTKARIRMDQLVETFLYRIVQEAMTNILLHAQASAVKVAINISTSFLELMVQDDGIGFDPAFCQASPGADRLHLGIRGMKERASLLGGKLEICSAPQAGTRVCCTLPLSYAARS